MNYGTVEGLNKKVSRIVFGCTGADMHQGKNVSPLLDAVYSTGINTFDTARVYGMSEQSLGLWLKNQKREDIVVISKGAHPSRKEPYRVNPKCIFADLATSLDMLGTDYIDIYLLHRDDENVPVGELVDALNECKSKGLIKSFGASNWTHQRIAEANAYAKEHNLTPFSSSSPHFSLAERLCDPWGSGMVTITGESNAPAREWYQKTQLPIFAYSSLSQGLLSGKIVSNRPETYDIFNVYAQKMYFSEENFLRLSRAEALAKEKGCTVAQIALSWIFTRGLNVFALTSASTPERIKENVDSLNIQLSDRETAWLNLETI